MLRAEVGSRDSAEHQWMSAWGRGNRTARDGISLQHPAEAAAQMELRLLRRNHRRWLGYPFAYKLFFASGWKCLTQQERLHKPCRTGQQGSSQSSLDHAMDMAKLHPTQQG